MAPTWGAIALFFFLYGLRMFAITGGYHRYFSHRTYRTSRWFQFVLALIGTTAFQKGPLWWAAHHRVHHRRSDQEGDPHSPVRDGFFWSHVGWILSRQSLETRWEEIRDLKKFPELRWLNTFHHVPGILLGAGVYFLGDWTHFVWGYSLSTVCCWHGTFVINSLAHRMGRRRYKTTDDSRNSALLAVITMGEGWHNNHHAYMSSTRQGFTKWEFDMSYRILKILEKMGLVWSLKEPPLKRLEKFKISAKKQIRQEFEIADLGDEPLVTQVSLEQALWKRHQLTH